MGTDRLRDYRASQIAAEAERRLRDMGRRGFHEGSESNYEKLFGTPERAARTLRLFSPFDCPGCVLESTCGGDKDVRCFIRDYDALLEWLRGEGGTDEA